MSVQTLLYQRMCQLLTVIWGVGTLTFVLMRSLPGDMAYRVAAGRYGQDNVDSHAAELVRQELNLDQHPLAAYGQWLLDTLQFNFGTSLVSGEPVIHMIEHQLGHSLLLAGAGIVVSIAVALPLGFLAAFEGGRCDRLLLWISTALRATPVFVLGLVLILALAMREGGFPVAGFGSWHYLVLPALTLGISLAAVSNRVVRDATVRVINSPFYQFSRVKGLSQISTFCRHGLRNIAVPVVAFMGIQLITVIEGIVMIESLFSWPGIGHGLAHAIFARDIPVIQGSALMMGLLFVLLNTANDLLCYWIDPRGGNSND
ncbi:ABC transporter permease [Ferrimonas lipolytica]|uniref:ABC transporter permease n=1 Tax=Ferrimonas lipolytica TaxID=2724191 RepID=A0A6H1UFU0_9GAMM|nr:ABC transporter permease [Ferrimonas lipolytica]QIZ76662.1 ABC transporter permease [Ferrimonas lipolytica]